MSRARSSRFPATRGGRCRATDEPGEGATHRGADGPLSLPHGLDKGQQGRGTERIFPMMEGFHETAHVDPPILGSERNCQVEEALYLPLPTHIRLPTCDDDGVAHAADADLIQWNAAGVTAGLRIGVGDLRIRWGGLGHSVRVTFRKHRPPSAPVRGTPPSPRRPRRPHRPWPGCARRPGRPRPRVCRGWP